MSTHTLASGPTARRARLLAPTKGRRLLVPLVLVGCVLLTRAVTQAVTPFIRQDDWAFLLPEGSPGAVPPAYYNLSEGRWLNSAWWWLVGQHGTPTTAALTYAVGYVLLVAGMWRVLHLSGIRPRPVVDALLGVALFASSVWVQLLYWPGALTPSVLLAAVAMWLLPWASLSRLRLALWLIGGAACAVLTYPPVGLVLLVFAVVILRAAPWRRVRFVVGGWVVGFGLGVAVAWSLNWVLNGHFGLQLASWREPNSLTSLDAFAVNAGRWLSATSSLWAGQWWVAVIALVGTVLGLRERRVRPRLERLLVAFAVAVGLDAAQTLASGLVTEARGQLWTWLAALLPVALLLDREPSSPAATPSPASADRAASIARSRLTVRVATALLVVLAVGGVLSWRADIGMHQAVRLQYAALAAAASAHEPGTAAPTVVVYQDPAIRATRSGRLMASTLFMAVRTERGSVPRWCRGEECRELAARASSGPVIHLGRVGAVPDVVGVVVPVPPDWI
jgi:hypothetical protein